MGHGRGDGRGRSRCFFGTLPAQSAHLVSEGFLPFLQGFLGPAYRRHRADAGAAVRQVGHQRPHGPFHDAPRRLPHPVRPLRGHPGRLPELWQGERPPLSR